MEKIKGLLTGVKAAAGAVSESIAAAAKESTKKLDTKKEVAQRSMGILRTRAELDALYSEVGKEAYGRWRGVEDAKDLTLLFQKIDEKQERIAELSRQIDILGGGQACSVCGRICPASYDYCPSCGKLLCRSESLQMQELDRDEEAFCAEEKDCVESSREQECTSFREEKWN